MFEKDVFINDRHRAKPEKRETHYPVQWFLFMIVMFNASVLFVCLFDWFLYFGTFSYFTDLSVIFQGLKIMEIKFILKEVLLL